MKHSTMIHETHPYRAWHDCYAGYSPRRFSTVEEAVEHELKWRSAFHLVRIELNGECQAVVLPTYYWDKD